MPPHSLASPRRCRAEYQRVPTRIFASAASSRGAKICRWFAATVANVDGISCACSISIGCCAARGFSPPPGRRALYFQDASLLYDQSLALLLCVPKRRVSSMGPILLKAALRRHKVVASDIPVRYAAYSEGFRRHMLKRQRELRRAETRRMI